MKISVIIPTWNEAERIGPCLEALQKESFSEIIVSDGGSQDNTENVVRSFPHVLWMSGSQGRAGQMNQASAEVEGDVLLFLHADVFLPQGAQNLIARVLKRRPEVVGGAFRTWTVSEGRKKWWHPLLHLADVRSRYSKRPYGDQAIFVRKEVFQEMGGFQEIPLMEDIEFSRRLVEKGEIVILPHSVRVSGRRFQARPIYFALCMNLFPFLFDRGVSPERLHRWYGDPR